MCYAHSIEKSIIIKPEKIHSSISADLYFLADTAFLKNHITKRTTRWFHPFVQS